MTAAGEDPPDAIASLVTNSENRTQAIRSVEAECTRAQQPRATPTFWVTPPTDSDSPWNNWASLPSAVVILGRQRVHMPGVCLKCSRSAFNWSAPSSHTCSPFVSDKLGGPREKLAGVAPEASADDTSSAQKSTGLRLPNTACSTAQAQAQPRVLGMQRPSRFRNKTGILIGWRKITDGAFLGGRRTAKIPIAMHASSSPSKRHQRRVGDGANLLMRVEHTPGCVVAPPPDVHQACLVL